MRNSPRESSPPVAVEGAAVSGAALLPGAALSRTLLSAITVAAVAVAIVPGSPARASSAHHHRPARRAVHRDAAHPDARPSAAQAHPVRPEDPAAVARRLDQALIERPTPGGLGRVDPNGGLYPAASLADFSTLLEKPAGRFGFLRAGSDGHFQWSSGRRARFWGVCISRRSISLPHEEIARVADCLARSGCNLVRFEALDGPDGLLSGSPEDSQHINPVFMDELHFWIACLRARGIYYYLDLLDFRRFLPGDDVPNADALGIAARPYAIFDTRLLELQEQFARQLLLTINPYTDLCPAADPALVMVELVNEHGLFMSITQIDKLAAPYNTELQQLWNRWLLKKYTTRDALAAHWLAAGTPLGAQEDPTSGTVRLMGMPPSESRWDKGGVRSARVREQVDFLADTQRDYFRTMREFLHRLGVICPITAAVTSTVGPDVLSVADELDCTAENYYADHPKYAGAEWKGSVYYDNDNQLRSSEPGQVAPQIALLRWNNRPVVVREWDTAWPNQYRATAIPDMAAYASLQDVDMVLLFTYVTGEPGDRLLDFANQCDPTVWGQFGAGASIFLDRLIQPARYTVDVLYSQYDLEHWGPYLSQLHRLAWSSLVRNVVSGALPPPARGVSVLSGRGGYGVVPTRNCLIFQRLDAVPPGDRVSSVENILRTNNIPLTVSPLSSGEFKFSGLVYGADGTEKVESEVGFLAQDVSRAHLTPVGVDSVGQMNFGAYDPARNEMILPTVSAVEGLRASLDILHAAGADVSHDEVAGDRWQSDTGEITRETTEGRLLVSAPGCALIAGEFPAGRSVRSGPLSLSTGNPDGSLSMVSLDGRSLARSIHWDLKLVTHASNSGQALETAPAGAPAPLVLRQVGSAPIITGGARSAAPTRVYLGDRLLIEAYVAGGTWELLRHGQRYDFFCDTPGVRVRVGGGPKILSVAHSGVRTPIRVDSDGSFLYPSGALAVEVLN